MSHPDGADSGTTRSSDDDETPTVLAGSRIVTALQGASIRVGAWVRQSFLYQWLTAEPDPEVIVIDLRETWTVGPFLQILDVVMDWLVDAAADSRAIDIAQRSITATRAAPLRAAGLAVAVVGLAVAVTGLSGGVSTTPLAVGIGLAVGGLIAMQDDRDWATLRETRPVTLALAALEPPDLPETSDDDPANERHTSDQSATATSQGGERDTADSQPDKPD